jgi:hypothetical protein
VLRSAIGEPGVYLRSSGTDDWASSVVPAQLHAELINHRIEEGLPIFVIPIQPLERVATRWEARLKKRTVVPTALP